MGKVPSKILENLWLGPRRWHGDFGWFQDNWPERIVSCCTKSAIIPPELKKVTKQLKINVDDSPETDMSEWFVIATEFINEARIQGKCVYVHCAQGVSRSSTICIAYMMLHANIKYENAYRFVELCRDVILPNEGFVEQLQALDSKRLGIYTDLKKKWGEVWFKQGRKDWRYMKNLLKRQQNYTLPREPSLLELPAKSGSALVITLSDRMVIPENTVAHLEDGPKDMLSLCEEKNNSLNYALFKNQDIRESFNLGYQLSATANKTDEARERIHELLLNRGEEKNEMNISESDFEEGCPFDVGSLQNRSTINLTGEERKILKNDWDFATSLQTRHLQHTEDFQVKTDNLAGALDTLRANVVSRPRKVEHLKSRRLFHPMSGDRGLLKLGGQENCKICMHSWQHGDVVSILSCKHVYHTDEILSWLKEADWCPSCRSLATDSRNQTKKSLFLL